MNIQLNLYATLRKYMPPAADRYGVAPGSTVGDLLDRLGVPRGEAKLIFINGVKRDLSAVIADGDRVGIFPPVGGG